MGLSNRTAKISSIIAALCIAIYIAAIAFGAVQIIVNIGERRDLAEAEFRDLADRASSSAVFQGFMTEAYRETINDFIAASKTPLLAVILTGSNGEYPFEQYPGSGIVWAGDSPRFKTGAGYPKEPFSMFLRIEGQRNVTIQAMYSVIDHGLFLRVLKNTLVAILAALFIAFITLIAEMVLKNRAPAYAARAAGLKPLKVRRDGKNAAPEKAAPEPRDQPSVPGDPFPPEEEGLFSPEDEEENSPFGGISFDPIDFPGEETPGENPPEENLSEGFPAENHPQGLFSPRSNIGWESYTGERLASELHRCAASEQDLTLLIAAFPEKTGAAEYRQFADEAAAFFVMRDLIFENGENGISVIIPGSDLEQGMVKSEEFHARINAKLPESFKARGDLCVGLSSRSGRLIDSGRIMLEASSALEKALEDPDSYIVAFKSDPEKYREFIKRRP